MKTEINTNTNTPAPVAPVRYTRIPAEPGAAEAAAKKFWEKMHGLEAANDRARQAGIPALKRLFELTETRDSGQIKIVAGVLAGLYNGHRFPLNLQDLRGLEAAILDDVLAVIKMDAHPEKEVHEYFKDGGKRFEKMFEKFGLENQNHD